MATEQPVTNETPQSHQHSARPTKAPAVVQPQETTKRFPRLPTPRAVAEMLKTVWDDPEFVPRETDGCTELVFRFRLLDTIRRKRQVFYAADIRPVRKFWPNALRAAYEEVDFGGKPVSKTLSNAFYQVFVASVRKMVERARSQYEWASVGLAEDMKQFGKAVRRKPGPQPAKRNERAKSLALRYKELFPKVKDLRTFIKQRGPSVTEEQLKQEIQKAFATDWISHVTNGYALKYLLVAPGHNKVVKSWRDAKWTAKQMTVGIMVCGEKLKRSGKRIRPSTIDELIRLGNKLLVRPPCPA